MAAKTPRGGELPLDQGSTPYEPKDAPENLAADGAVTVIASDEDTGDDLTIAALKLVPGLERLDVAKDKVSVGAITDPTSKVRGLSPTVIGNAVVSFPDGKGQKQVNVIASVLNFPVSATQRGAEDGNGNKIPQVRVLKPTVDTAYYYCFDDVTGVIEDGEVPEENSQGRKRAQQPWVPEDRDWAVDDSVYEISTGLYWNVDSQNGGTVLAAQVFKAAAPKVLENLDDWDDEWAPDLDYTFDYAEQALKGRDADGAFTTSDVVLPADPLNAGGYSEPIKAAAAKQLLPTDATFVSGVVPPRKCSTDAEWAAKFDQMYVTGKADAVVGTGTTGAPQFPAKAGTVHPSVVGALRAALFAAADARTSDVYFQTADDAGQKAAQDGYKADAPGAAWDVKQADDNTLVNPLSAADALVGVPKPVVP